MGNFMANKDTSVARGEAAEQPTGPVVLCFGDSLTAGFITISPYTGEYHPYATKLKEALDEDHQIQCCIHPVGASGITGTALASGKNLESKKNRDVCNVPYPGLKQAIRSFGTRGRNGDTDSQNRTVGVVIMAGTNDLADAGKMTDEIVEAIVTLHRICHEEFGIKTIACSVPGNRASTVDDTDHGESKSHVLRWRHVNSKLKEFATGTDMCRFFDVDSKVPFHEKSEQWESDGLHMSELGYDDLGRGLAADVAAHFFQK